MLEHYIYGTYIIGEMAKGPTSIAPVGWLHGSSEGVDSSIMAEVDRAGHGDDDAEDREGRAEDPVDREDR